MKIIFKVFLILLLGLSFWGCQNNSIEQYNELSREHHEVVNNAFNVLNQSISHYNDQDYNSAQAQSLECKNLFLQASDLSDRSIELAKNIKGKDWLVDFKKYSKQSENIRSSQCDLLYNLSIATVNKKDDEAQKLIQDISVLNDKYDKLQIILEDIKNQHPETFKNK
jgi:hypothetical protein